MDFYKMLADSYDKVFDVSKSEMDFLLSCIKGKDTSILDIACGTGQYTIELFNLGYIDIHALDLDPSMIEKAVSKSKAIDFKVGNMLDFGNLYNRKFGFIYCTGNSIAHLNDLDEILSFLKETYSLLEKGGCLALQIINFDRIFSGNITSLPLIKKDNLVFERIYELHSKNVTFKGILSIDNERYSSSLELLAPRHDELIELLVKAGFPKYTAYGSFAKDPYHKKLSYALVLKAFK